MAGTDSSPLILRARLRNWWWPAQANWTLLSFYRKKQSSGANRSTVEHLSEIDLSRFDPQTKVSRRHARIIREGNAFLLEDLGSVNGTVINDIIHLEPRQPRALDSGDRIKMGETTLHFLLG